MRRLKRFIYILVLTLPTWSAGAAPDTVEHDLTVRLFPDSGTIQVRDTLALSPGTQRWIFLLQADLAPRVVAGQARLASLGRQGDFERHVLLPAAGVERVTLGYQGRIQHAMEQIEESPGRSHQRSRGTIGSAGVFLDGASGWYPWAADSLQRFRLQVTVPAGWRAVSQGDGPEIREDSAGVTLTWQEHRPQDDIYLIAAPFTLYRRPAGGAEAQVYLREPDAGLAERYLAATERYLRLYSRLLGDYPYGKFALVENFWDTGYGMPSFTLLGSRVIRLPFIIESSYPHEILHNWWGNGVFVDYASGNWSEGLTTYLADHLIKEERGRGAAYRRDALQRFADYVGTGQDFPLRDFRARHSGASQSVGYGKGFMLFHMLRRELGDAAFIDGLRRFYRDNLFRTAGYRDLQRAFEAASGRPLELFFRQWLERTGAPTLALEGVKLEPTPAGFRLAGRIAQTQAAAPFRLQVPLVVRFAQGDPIETRLVMTGRHAEFALDLPSRPVALDVDPRFDLFRSLYPEESPPSLSALFGADRGLILLPADAPADLAAGYSALAAAWTRGYDGWEVRSDQSTPTLPEDRPVWVLGWENRYRDEVGAAAASLGAELSADAARLPGTQALERRDGSVAMVVPGAGPQDPPRAFLGAYQAQALPGLARKLPHYGKYGYLAFQGEAPTNSVKGQWQVRHSPLSVRLGDETPAPLPPLPALTADLRSTD